MYWVIIILMLRNNERGSIIGLIVGIIGLVLLWIMFSNSVSAPDGGDEGDFDSSVIDQAMDTGQEVQETGERANSILDGLRGN